MAGSPPDNSVIRLRGASYRGVVELLFVCTGNTCRSPMAAAIVQRKVDDRHLPVRVRSAGIRAGDTVAGEARLALRRRGIAIARRKAVQLTEEMVDRAELILCAAEEHRVIVAGAIPSAAARTFVWGDFVHRSRQLHRTASLADLLVAVEGTPRLDGRDLADPIGRGQAAYDQTADTIDRLGRETVQILERLGLASRTTARPGPPQAR